MGASNSPAGSIIARSLQGGFQSAQVEGHSVRLSEMSYCNSSCNKNQRPPPLLNNLLGLLRFAPAEGILLDELHAWLLKKSAGRGKLNPSQGRSGASRTAPVKDSAIRARRFTAVTDLFFCCRGAGGSRRCSPSNSGAGIHSGTRPSRQSLCPSPSRSPPPSARSAGRAG